MCDVVGLEPRDITFVNDRTRELNSGILSWVDVSIEDIFNVD